MYNKAASGWSKHLDFIILDMLMVQLAYTISCNLRMGWMIPYMETFYRHLGMVLILIQISVEFFCESHKGILRRGKLKEVKAAFRDVFLTMLLAIAYLFFDQTASTMSRLIVFTTSALAASLLCLERLLWKKFLKRRGADNAGKHMLLVISSNDKIRHILEVLTQNDEYGSFQIIGAAVIDKDLRNTKICGIPVVGYRGDILEYAKSSALDEVFLEFTDMEHLTHNLRECFLYMGITVHIGLTELPRESSRYQAVGNLGGYSVLSSSIRMATPRQRLLKRCMDICGGLAGVLLTGVIAIFLAPVIYLQSPGPIFFSQERIGRNGRRFRIYKFRSMHPDAEKCKEELMDKNKMEGLMFKIDDDPRVIPIGKFIRRTSLDEFPQFWNVLKGDMSLVGTRPPTVDEWEKYDLHHRRRMAAKPGLTGMWQVSGRSDITDFEQVVDLDTKYISEWSLGLDIKILFQTVLVVLKGQGSV